MHQEVVLIRFLLAFVASLVFGLTRQRLGKPIGFGTFIFVALGACGLSLTAIGISPETPLPLLGAIVTGIGFLGAGALFRTGERVAGFTSAATIWIFAVFGLLVGVGEYLVGGLVYGSVWTVSLIDHWLERRWIGVHQRRLHVEVALGTSDESLSALGLPGRSSATSVRMSRERAALTLTYSIDRAYGETNVLVERLESSDQVLSMTIEAS